MSAYLMRRVFWKSGNNSFHLIINFNRLFQTRIQRSVFFKSSLSIIKRCKTKEASSSITHKYVNRDNQLLFHDSMKKSLHLLCIYIRNKRLGFSFVLAGNVLKKLQSKLLQQKKVLHATLRYEQYNTFSRFLMTLLQKRKSRSACVACLFFIIWL